MKFFSKSIIASLFVAFAVSFTLSAQNANGPILLQERSGLYLGPAQDYNRKLVGKEYYKGFPHTENPNRKIYFGWFRGNGDPAESATNPSMFWTGERGYISWQEGGMALQDLPDSLDCVSLFGVQSEITQARIDDMRAFQARGAKVFYSMSMQGQTSWTMSVKGFPGCPASVSSVEQWADYIFKVCEYYKFNGFNLGWEKTTGVLSSQNGNKLIELLRQKMDDYNKKLGDDETYKMYLCLDVPNPRQGWSGIVSSISDANCNKVDLWLWQMYDVPVNRDNLVTTEAGSLQTALNALGKSGQVLETMKKRSVICSSAQTLNVNNHPLLVMRDNLNVAGCGVYYLDLEAFVTRNSWYDNVRNAIRVLSRR